MLLLLAMTINRRWHTKLFYGHLARSSVKNSDIEFQNSVNITVPATALLNWSIISQFFLIQYFVTPKSFGSQNFLPK